MKALAVSGSGQGASILYALGRKPTPQERRTRSMRLGESGVVCAGGEDELISWLAEEGYHAGHVEADVAVRLCSDWVERALVRCKLEALGPFPV